MSRKASENGILYIDKDRYNMVVGLFSDKKYLDPESGSLYDLSMQKERAAAIGVSPETLSRCTSGRQQISEKTLNKLCNLLGDVNPMWLCGKSDIPNRSSLSLDRELIDPIIPDDEIKAMSLWAAFAFLESIGFTVTKCSGNLVTLHYKSICYDVEISSLLEYINLFRDVANGIFQNLISNKSISSHNATPIFLDTNNSSLLSGYPSDAVISNNNPISDISSNDILVVICSLFAAKLKAAHYVYEGAASLDGQANYYG